MLTYKNKMSDVTLTKFKQCQWQAYPNRQLKCSQTLSIYSVSQNNLPQWLALLTFSYVIFLISFSVRLIDRSAILTVNSFMNPYPN